MDHGVVNEGTTKFAQVVTRAEFQQMEELNRTGHDQSHGGSPNAAMLRGSVRRTTGALDPMMVRKPLNFNVTTNEEVKGFSTSPTLDTSTEEEEGGQNNRERLAPLTLSSPESDNDRSDSASGDEKKSNGTSTIVNNVRRKLVRVSSDGEIAESMGGRPKQRTIGRRGHHRQISSVNESVTEEITQRDISNNSVSKTETNKMPLTSKLRGMKIKPKESKESKELRSGKDATQQPAEVNIAKDPVIRLPGEGRGTREGELRDSSGGKGNREKTRANRDKDPHSPTTSSSTKGSTKNRTTPYSFYTRYAHMRVVSELQTFLSIVTPGVKVQKEGFRTTYFKCKYHDKPHMVEVVDLVNKGVVVIRCHGSQEFHARVRDKFRRMGDDGVVQAPQNVLSTNQTFPGSTHKAHTPKSK